MTAIRSWLGQYFSESVLQNPLFDRLLDMQRQMGFGAASPVEISKKVVGGQEYLNRLNFLHKDQLVERYATCVAFVEETQKNVGMSQEAAQSLALVMDEGPSNLYQIVTGLDLRPEPGQSRFKIWFEFTDAAGLIEQTLKLLGYYEQVKDYIVRDVFLLGFGFYPDGRSEVKPHLNYGEFRHDLRARLILSSLFEKRVFDAFDFGKPLYLGFRGSEPRIFIYFCHTDVEAPLRSLQIQIPPESLLLNGQKPDILGAYYDDLVKQPLHEYNLYYRLSPPLPEPN